MNNPGEQTRNSKQAKIACLEEGSRPFYISEYEDYDAMFQTFFRLQKDCKLNQKNIQKSTQSTIAHNYIQKVFTQIKQIPFIDSISNLPNQSISTPQNQKNTSTTQQSEKQSKQLPFGLYKLSYDSNYCDVINII